MLKSKTENRMTHHRGRQSIQQIDIEIVIVVEPIVREKERASALLVKMLCDFDAGACGMIIIYHQNQWSRQFDQSWWRCLWFCDEMNWSVARCLVLWADRASAVYSQSQYTYLAIPNFIDAIFNNLWIILLLSCSWRADSYSCQLFGMCFFPPSIHYYINKYFYFRIQLKINGFCVQSQNSYENSIFGTTDVIYIIREGPIDKCYFGVLLNHDSDLKIDFIYF